VLNGQPAIAPPLAGGSTWWPRRSAICANHGAALEVLASADLIACEDTRVSRKLLEHYGSPRR